MGKEEMERYIKALVFLQRKSLCEPLNFAGFQIISVALHTKNLFFDFLLLCFNFFLILSQFYPKLTTKMTNCSFQKRKRQIANHLLPDCYIMLSLN